MGSCPGSSLEPVLAARPPSELEAIRDLLGDFGAPGWGPGRAEEAFDLFADRYRVLGSQYVGSAISVEVAIDEPGSVMTLPLASTVVLRHAHERLFREVYINAGVTRQPGDPGGSAVHFGGQKGDRRRMRFSGVPAAQVESALLEAAWSHLVDRRRGPRTELEAARDDAVRFYADLSRIHPFYDGNGRTGRFLVSVYLHLHGWLVEWGELEKRDREFIKRINNVIEKATAQTDYDGLLVDFWRRYVVRTDDLG